VVVRKRLLGLREDSAREDAAKVLVADLAAAVGPFDEDVLGDVVPKTSAVDHAGAEIFGRKRADECAEFEVVGGKLRQLDHAPAALRLDHLLIRRSFAGGGLLRIGRPDDAGDRRQRDEEKKRKREGLEAHGSAIKRSEEK